MGKARLMFWDLGGQEELQSLWDKVSYELNMTVCHVGDMWSASCDAVGYISPGVCSDVLFVFIMCLFSTMLNPMASSM